MQAHSDDAAAFYTLYFSRQDLADLYGVSKLFCADDMWNGGRQIEERRIRSEARKDTSGETDDNGAALLRRACTY